MRSPSAKPPSVMSCAGPRPRTDYIDVLAILVGHDRLVVDQHCPELNAAPKLHARVQTRGERAVGFGTTARRLIVPVAESTWL